MPAGFVGGGFQTFRRALIGRQMIQAKFDRIDFKIGSDLVEKSLTGETARYVARGAQIARAQGDRLGKMPVDVMRENQLIAYAVERAAALRSIGTARIGRS